MALTKEQIKKYLDDPLHCPNCDNDIRVVGDDAYGDYNVWRSIKCDGCGAIYTEEYTLTGLEENPNDDEDFEDGDSPGSQNWKFSELESKDFA